MKRLSEKEIAKLRLSGKKVIDLKPIEKPKPIEKEKPKPDPMNELAVAVGKAVERCEKVVQINATAALEIIDTLAKIRDMEPHKVVVEQKAAPVPRAWRFDVVRDGNGLIETINATRG